MSFELRSSATSGTAGTCSPTCAIGEVPDLEEIIACNEAVREPDEASPSADDDDLDRVARALERARTETEPVEAAAALAFEIAYAQGFFEGNKRTAVLIARWFIATNTALDPDVVIPRDDHELGDLLIAAARGEQTDDAMRDLLRRRATG